jgi:hypothetical protein
MRPNKSLDPAIIRRGFLASACTPPIEYITETARSHAAATIDLIDVNNKEVYVKNHPIRPSAR